MLVQVLYANEGENRRDAANISNMIVDSDGKADSLKAKGHEFVNIMYHLPTNCEVCARPLWHMFRPPPAIECQREYQFGRCKYFVSLIGFINAWKLADIS